MNDVMVSALVALPVLVAEGLVYLVLRARDEEAARGTHRRRRGVLAPPIELPVQPVDSLPVRVARLRDLELAAMRRLDDIQRDALARFAVVGK